MRISLFLLALLGAFAGCRNVEYGDPGAVETLTIDYGSTDLQTLSAEMVESLISAPALGYLQNPGKGDDQRIIMYVGSVENRTSEHIDTQAITDRIQTSLLKSGKFRFVASDAGQLEIGDQVRFQQESGRVREDMMRDFGLQLGADVVLYGTLSSLDKKTKRKEDVFYQFVLKTVNIDTGELIWQEIAELRKTR